MRLITHGLIIKLLYIINYEFEYQTTFLTYLFLILSTKISFNFIIHNLVLMLFSLNCNTFLFRLFFIFFPALINLSPTFWFVYSFFYLIFHCKHYFRFSFLILYQQILTWFYLCFVFLWKLEFWVSSYKLTGGPKGC